MDTLNRAVIDPYNGDCFIREHYKHKQLNQNVRIKFIDYKGINTSKLVIYSGDMQLTYGYISTAWHLLKCTNEGARACRSVIESCDGITRPVKPRKLERGLRIVSVLYYWLNHGLVKCDFGCTKTVLTGIFKYS